MLFGDRERIENGIGPGIAMVAVYRDCVPRDINNTEVIGLVVIVNVPFASDGWVDVSAS